MTFKFLKHYFAVLPIFMRNHRTKNCGRIFVFCIIAVFSHISAECVDSFLNTLESCNFRCFVAFSENRRAIFCAGITIIAVVVMSKLNNNRIAGFYFRHNFVPASFVLECSTAASADGSINDVNFFRFEKLPYFLSPNRAKEHHF